MIHARTKQQKIALAEGLRQGDPGMLEDLKMFSSAFGPLAEVYYQADDIKTQKKVVSVAMGVMRDSHVNNDAS